MKTGTTTGWIIVLLLVGGLGWMVYARLRQNGGAERGRGGPEPAAVEVAAIEHGIIVERRTFSGTLEAPTEFVVAPKVGGVIEKLTVDLADPVTRGQVLARLDDDEHRQAVAQAEADLAVARANLAEAMSSLEIAQRAFDRVSTLRERGVASESDLDTARAKRLSSDAAVQVATAQVTRAEAALEAARIRLGYTTVTAAWAEGSERRVVSARYVDEGDTASANTPLLSIIELNPINAVLYVTEKDYAALAPGQTVDLTTDAYPRETFEGTIARIAPAFEENSRQARVELRVENDDHRLKPGMFVKANVVMQRIPDAVMVPEEALTQRNDQTGVFLVSDNGSIVRWQLVTTGVREGGRVQVDGADLTGRVVTLGQHLVDDGSPITIPADASPPTPATP